MKRRSVKRLPKRIPLILPWVLLSVRSTAIISSRRQNSKPSAALNDWTENAAFPYARPVRSYNQGYIHGIGVSVDMGLECFIAERLSVGLALNFTPLMLSIQPRTWTVYEGFNNWSGKVEEFTNLVSPGSNALLYGTENIGCRISLQYYFGK